MSQIPQVKMCGNSRISFYILFEDLYFYQQEKLAKNVKAEEIPGIEAVWKKKQEKTKKSPAYSNYNLTIKCSLNFIGLDRSWRIQFAITPTRLYLEKPLPNRFGKHFNRQKEESNEI